MAKTKQARHIYDESKVKTLSSLEHIRLRTGMYIGRTGDGSHYDDGIYILLKETLDNAVDEFIMGYGRKIDISLKMAASASVIMAAAFRWAKWWNAYRASIPAQNITTMYSNSALD